ncbi:MAG: dicarboxylate/amino acid:cation symporter [Candidatus Wallbacteria bacterium]|nr:dicarboxylate/amino acid:cation symporter [Candidatus Wallbacteria bacterium]
MIKNSFLKAYSFSICLIISIVIGSIIGLIMKEKAEVLKPLGDIFLNLLFTIVVPMVFFSISSTVAKMSDMKRLGKIIGWMVVVFVVTGLISAVIMLIGVNLYPPTQGNKIAMDQPVNIEKISLSQQLVRTLTVPDFNEIFSKKSIFPLIVFSFMIGLAASAAGPLAKPFADFLISGNEVMTKAIGYVMLYAPVGLGAYFAYLVGTFGTQLFGSYIRAMALYYPLSIGYFAIVFTFYVWLSAGMKGLKAFWANILPSALTAWGTGSGLATLPINLEAAKKMGLPNDIREVVVNIGASVHSDGSSLAAVMKMALLFGLFGIPFSGVQTVFLVLAVALLCGTVISGIPSGGMLGEILIITIFGFPPESMPIITMLGQLVDPPATMINVVGDNVCGMLVARVVNGPDWMEKEFEARKISAEV